MKSQANIKNINSLIIYIHKNFEYLSIEDYISAMNKFQELESNEINPKIKLYDFLDYVIQDPKNLKDTLYLKTMMRIMIGNGLHDKCYWDLIKQNLIQHNLIYSNKNDYLYYLKSFSIVEYGDSNKSNIWNIFEEFFLEQHFSFELEEIKQIALCFANSQKGTDQFWEKLFDILDFEESKSIDFVLNFSISIGNYLNAIKNKNFSRKALFVDLINVSINYINAFIKDYEYDVRQVIYSSFKNFHDDFYEHRLQNYYNVKADSFEFLIEELEKLFLNHLHKNVKSLTEDDIDGIAKILAYFAQEEINVKLFDFGKYEQEEEPEIIKKFKYGKGKDVEANNDLDEKAQVEAKRRKEEEIILRKSNENNYREMTIEAFKHNIDKFCKASHVISFMKFFKKENFKAEKIKEIIENYIVWEKVIDEIHLFSIDELLSLALLGKHYNVEYSRLWIFIQTFIRKYFEIAAIKPENAKGNLELLDKTIAIFDEEQFRLNDHVLLQFIYFLRNTKDKLIVIDSYRFSDSVNINSMPKDFSIKF